MKYSQSTLKKIKSALKEVKDETTMKDIALVAGSAAAGALISEVVGEFSMSKKAEAVFEKLAKKNDQAGGQLFGAAAGFVAGKHYAQKGIKLLGKLPKGVGPTLAVAGGIAGVPVGAHFGKHFGHALDEMFGMGQYKDRGKYKKK